MYGDKKNEKTVTKGMSSVFGRADAGSGEQGLIAYAIKHLASNSITKDLAKFVMERMGVTSGDAYSKKLEEGNNKTLIMAILSRSFGTITRNGMAVTNPRIYQGVLNVAQVNPSDVVVMGQRNSYLVPVASDALTSNDSWKISGGKGYAIFTYIVSDIAQNGLSVVAHIKKATRFELIVHATVEGQSAFIAVSGNIGESFDKATQLAFNLDFTPNAIGFNVQELLGDNKISLTAGVELGLKSFGEVRKDSTLASTTFDLGGLKVQTVATTTNPVVGVDGALL